MSIIFIQMDDPYTEEVFELTKEGLYPFVDEVFGWDDEFQKQRMRDDYKREWFYWIYEANTKVGYACFKPYDHSLHLHLIVLAQKFIGNGLGKKVMAAICKIAETENRDITLSSFKCNKRAVNLYKSLNYEVTEEEEHFLLFRNLITKRCSNTALNTPLRGRLWTRICSPLGSALNATKEKCSV